MEKKRGNQVMAIAALFIAVIGLSLGFAAFSNTLTIKSSATVTPDATLFDVNLSSAAASTIDGNLAGRISPTPTAGSYNQTYFTASSATITNETSASASGSTNARIEGLKANFTEPGQTVTYLLYARNDGNYVGYLNGVTFSSKTAANNETGAKVCYSKSDVDNEVTNEVTESLLTAACNAITITVRVGGTVSDAATHTINGGTLFTETKADKIVDYTTGHSLAIGASEPILVTIAYAAGDANRVDAPMEVEFGDIILTYGSVD